MGLRYGAGRPIGYGAQVRRVLPLLCLGVLACGPPPPNTCVAGGGFGGASGGTPTPSLDDVGIAGAAQQVRLALPLAPSCPGSGPKVDEVVVEVLDPTNQPISHSETAPMSDSLSGPSTTVSFTPTVPGSYHLSARFEPAFGRAQADIEVAVDRTGAAVKTVDLPIACDALETLPSGVLCQLPSEVRLYVGGVQTQRWDAEQFAVSGNVVWLLVHSQVSRWVDTGAAMLVNTPASAGPSTFVSGYRMLVVNEQSAAVLGNSSAQMFRFNAATGLVSEPVLSLPYVGAQFVGFVPPALTTALIVGSDRYCRLSLEVAGAPDCVEALSLPLSADATGAWSVDASAIRHRSFGDPLAGPLKTASLPLPQRPLTDGARLHFESAPVLWTSAAHTRQLVPARTATGIVFEQYPSTTGFFLAGGSAKVLWAQDSSGHQKLFTR